MVKVVYIESAGPEHVIDVPAGASLMRGAVDNLVPGIVGECGGQMACGTCHVFIDAPWLGLLGPPSALEQGMLAVSEHTCTISRLACQVHLSDALDGIAVRIPGSQP